MLTFTVFAVRARDDDDRTLDTARVFTALSLFALLSEPLTSLVMSLATFLGAVGSFSRIQHFLESDEQVDMRKIDVLANTPEPTDAVTVRNASFGWNSGPDRTPLLNAITLSVPLQKLTMVVGPVGSGKSTLLLALLGEIPILDGSVRLRSTSTAYCSQSSWHTNGSIRQAIVGSERFDEDWYARVIRACALRRDFRQLPKGDASHIGSQGIALSGGQSQRIVRRSLVSVYHLHSRRIPVIY